MFSATAGRVKEEGRWPKERNVESHLSSRLWLHRARVVGGIYTTSARSFRRKALLGLSTLYWKGGHDGARIGVVGHLSAGGDLPRLRVATPGGVL